MMNIKSDFPALRTLENNKKFVYLDSAATAQQPIPVIDKVDKYYMYSHANPGRGIYSRSLEASTLQDEARKVVSDFIGSLDSSQIIFTTNATEALNLVSYSYGLNFLKPNDEILVAVSEHHSNLVPWQRVAKHTGAKILYVYPDKDGYITVENVKRKISKHTKIFAFAHVSNVLGVENDIVSLTKLAHEFGAITVVDATQSVAHMRINVSETDVDFLAFSGHKIYGPMGIGVLYGKRELLEKMPPFLSGGDMIEQVHESGTTYAPLPEKFEAGTRNVGGEVGLAEAIKYVKNIGFDNIRRHEQNLTRKALKEMQKIPYVTIYGTKDYRKRVGPIAFNVHKIHPHDVASILDSEGVAIRAGHHCAQPLMDYLEIGSCCRISFGVYSEEEDIDIFIHSIKEVWRILGYELERSI